MEIVYNVEDSGFKEILVRKTFGNRRFCTLYCDRDLLEAYSDIGSLTSAQLQELEDNFYALVGHCLEYVSSCMDWYAVAQYAERVNGGDDLIFQEVWINGEKEIV